MVVPKLRDYAVVALFAFALWPNLGCSTSEEVSSGAGTVSGPGASHEGPAKSAAPPAMSDTLSGDVNLINNGQIIGWAWDQAKGDNPQGVDICEGDRILGTIAADQFRKDLLDARVGNGRHGFVFSIPAALKDGKSHVIAVKFAGTQNHLEHSPTTVVLGADSETTLLGYVDAVDGKNVIGWAWDKSKGDAPVKVDVYHGETLLGTIAADQFSKELRDAGIGNGHHAFLFPVPPALKDGKSHTISVMFAGTKTQLNNSPKTAVIALP
jgi:hypothetical protein